MGCEQSLVSSDNEGDDGGCEGAAEVSVIVKVGFAQCIPPNRLSLLIWRLSGSFMAVF